MRIQKITYLNSALDFVKVGVQMRMKPSAEYLCDGKYQKRFGFHLGHHVEVHQNW